MKYEIYINIPFLRIEIILRKKKKKKKITLVGNPRIHDWRIFLDTR